MTLTTTLFRSVLLGLFTLIAAYDTASAQGAPRGEVHVVADTAATPILTDLQDAINAALGWQGVRAHIDGDGDLAVSLDGTVAFWIRARSDGTLAYFTVVTPDAAVTPRTTQLGKCRLDIGLLPNGAAYVFYTAPEVDSTEEGLLHMQRFLEQVEGIVA